MIRHGSLIEVGTHMQLMSEGGTYAGLYRTYEASVKDESPAFLERTHA